MNDIQKMPDAYYKLVGGNLYNLLALASMIQTEGTTDFNDIADSRDIQNATGATLDNYGAMVGVARSGATDEQYRTKILNKISVNTSGVDANSIIRSIGQTLNTDSSGISISEGNMAVSVLGLTLSQIAESGYSESEIRQMIENLLPIGVALEYVFYYGTFEFGASYEYDEDTGFGNVEQTIGGTLGEIV